MVYNPFLKVEKFKDYLSDFKPDTVVANKKRMKVGSIWIEKKIDFQDLSLVLRKINHFYGIVIAMRKGMESSTPLVTMNSSFLKYASSIMDGYLIGFRTNAKCPNPMKSQNGPSKIILKDVPRHSIIFTKSKEGKDININHFFKEKKDSDMLKVIEACEKIIHKESNRCKTLFIKHKVFKKVGLYHNTAIYGSYLNNLKDIKELVLLYRERGLNLEFDLKYFTECMVEMVYNTFDFHFKRKWVVYPINRKKNKGGSDVKRNHTKSNNKISVGNLGNTSNRGSAGSGS